MKTNRKINIKKHSKNDNVKIKMASNSTKFFDSFCVSYKPNKNAIEFALKMSWNHTEIISFL